MSSASSKKVTGKDFGKPSWVVAKTILIFGISQVIGGVLATAFLYAGGVNDPISTLNHSPLAEFFLILLIESLTVGLVVLALKRGGWLLRRVRGLSLKDIGFSRRPRWRDLFMALGGFVIFYLLLIVAGIILSAIFPDIENGTQDVGFNDLTGVFEKILAFVGLVFLAPIGEETLVRGYLYTGLRQTLRFWPALLITSLLFGAAHLETGTTAALLWSAAVNTFILSLVLVYLREKTGALYACILLHSLNNAVAFGFHFHAVMF